MEGYRKEAALTSCFINMQSFKTRRIQPLKGSTDLDLDLSLSLRHGSPVASRASLTGPSDPLLAGCPSNAGQAVFAELGSDKMPSALKPRVVGLRPLDRLHGTSGTVVGWLVVG